MRIAATVLGAQCAAAVIVAALFFILSTPRAALAALAGAFVAIAPTAYMALRMSLALRLREEPQALVGAVSRGIAGRFAMTVALFVLVVAWFPEQILPVMSAYVACVAMFVAGALVSDKE